MPMQPSPSAETSSGAVVPRVRRSMEVSVMRPSLGLRARSKSRFFVGRISGGGLQPVDVDTDLAVDRAEMLLDFRELGEHTLSVCAQELEPLGLVAVAGTHQAGVAADLTD